MARKVVIGGASLTIERVNRVPCLGAKVALSADAGKNFRRCRREIRKGVDHLVDDRPLHPVRLKAFSHSVLGRKSRKAAELRPYPNGALLILAQGAYIIIRKAG